MSSRRQLLNDAYTRLIVAGASDAQLDAQWILAHVTGMPRLRLLTELDSPASQAEVERFEALLMRREAGEPLQYVLGEAPFMGHMLAVDARVLIPRADTEALCEAAIARIGQQEIRVLDIGAGSGALAITLALACPAAAVTAVDISPEALGVAQANGVRLGASVEWLQSDLFAALDARQFEVIVSNPPYIPSGELEGLQREVQREPALALDGGSDGLDFYRRITQGLPAHLKIGGSLLFEVGDGQAEAVSAMMDGHFIRITTLRDMAGLCRVVAGDGYAG